MYLTAYFWPLTILVLLIAAIFFPPLMMINMPLLIGRAAFLFWRARQKNRVL